MHLAVMVVVVVVVVVVVPFRTSTTAARLCSCGVWVVRDTRAMIVTAQLTCVAAESGARSMQFTPSVSLDSDHCKARVKFHQDAAEAAATPQESHEAALAAAEELGRFTHFRCGVYDKKPPPLNQKGRPCLDAAIKHLRAACAWVAGAEGVDPPGPSRVPP